MNVQWRNGFLYTSHTVSDQGRAECRWYQFSTVTWPPQLVQSGAVESPMSDVHTFYPAIAVNRFDDNALVCAMSSPSTYSSIQATGRLAGDPIGTMGALVELAIGDTGSDGRWGDYFDVTVDPTDDSTFWMVGQYARSFGWETWIERFVVSCPSDINGSGTVDIIDLLSVLAEWGNDGGAADVNADGLVDVEDLLTVIAAWGPCP